MRAVVAILVLTAPALAGCLSPSDLVPARAPGVDVADLLPYMDLTDDHDHAAPHQHDAGWNLDIAAWTPNTGDLNIKQPFNQVWTAGDIAFVSAYYVPPAGHPGVIAVDLSDPAHPTPVGTYDSEELVPIDVHASPDGRFIAVAGHRLYERDVPARPTPACTALPVGGAFPICEPFGPAGVQLIDVTDPANMKRAATYTSVPSGAHTVKTVEVDGELYVLLASYGAMATGRLASSVEVLRYDADAPQGPALTMVARFFPEPASGHTGEIKRNIHDLWVEDAHAVTGDRLLYLAYWDGGIVIADLNDVTAPRQIAQWEDWDQVRDGQMHFVRPFPELIDGKHITVGAPEYSSADHAGKLYLFDTTDPTAPRLFTTWTIPGNPVNPGNYYYSPHNFDLTADGRIAYAHYHAGVWVLDLVPAIVNEGADPTVLGYRFPVPPTSDFAWPEDAAAGFVWNAVWLDDDTILASDRSTGLYVMDLTTPTPGMPPYAGLV